MMCVPHPWISVSPPPIRPSTALPDTTSTTNVSQRRVKARVNATSTLSITGHCAPVNGLKGGTSRGQVVLTQAVTERRRRRADCSTLPASPAAAYSMTCITQRSDACRRKRAGFVGRCFVSGLGVATSRDVTWKEMAGRKARQGSTLVLGSAAAWQAETSVVFVM